MTDFLPWLILGAALLGVVIGVLTTHGVHSVISAVKSSRTRISPDLEATLEEVPLIALVFDRSLSIIGMNRTAREHPVTVETLQTSSWFRSYLREAAHSRVALVRPSNELEPYWAHLYALEDGAVVALVMDDQDKYDTESLRREFVANASHELNTPVAALSLLSEAIIAADGDPERIRHFTASLSQEIERLSRLTKDIARLSEAQSGWESDALEPIDMVTLVHNVVSEHQTLAANVNIELVVEPREQPLVVSGEQRSLKVAVTNLVENAIKYSPAGTRVSLGFGQGESIGWVTVTDQGIGIDPEQQPHIFKRFYRVDKGRSRRSGGTGLGLAIARNTARSLRGDLTVWSQPGIGSTFTLRLPLVKEDDGARNTVS